jgi:hypothetical protein
MRRRLEYLGRPPERAAPVAFQRGDRPANGPDRQWLQPTIFRRRGAPLHREAKSPASAILR